jgi:cell division protein ZapE
LNIREAYEDRLSLEGHVRDLAQVEVVDRLHDLQRRILREPPPVSRFWARFSRQDNSDRQLVTGMYLWGGVGRGKTFLMDLFFDTLPISEKRRVHFHRMMRDVHERLARLQDREDPLALVAADIAAETRVLCFDEFYVSDIGDAMILGRLLEGLFQGGVTLVATSNSPPDELYKDGLQRQRFLPAIDLLKDNTDVLRLDSGTDYRLRLLQTAGTFLTPDDDVATRKLKYYFDQSANTEIRDQCRLDINGREIVARRSAKGIVWFDFAALCEGPRSPADYIEIARWYPSVIVSGVPKLGSSDEDQARRFIALVDEFYDRRVKLILSAESSAASLYSGSRLRFEFERTVSRLIEMQSSQYLALPHLA